MRRAHGTVQSVITIGRCRRESWIVAIGTSQFWFVHYVGDSERLSRPFRCNQRCFPRTCQGMLIRFNLSFVHHSSNYLSLCLQVFQNWEHSQLQLTKRRENKAKLELANRNDKTEAAQKEIVEWEAKVQRCQQEFEEISQEIKKEIDRFEVKRVHEFKSIIIKYLEDQMAHQQQVKSQWYPQLISPISNMNPNAIPFYSWWSIGTVSFQPQRRSLKMCESDRFPLNIYFLCLLIIAFKPF